MNVPNHEKKAFRDMTPEERSVLIEWKLRGGTIEYLGDETGWYKSTGEYLRFGGIYRTPPRQLVIPWEHIKPEYKWAAMDEIGSTWVYENKPEMLDSSWTSGDGLDGIDALNIDTTGIDWRESLTARPEGV